MKVYVRAYEVLFAEIGKVLEMSVKDFNNYKRTGKLPLDVEWDFINDVTADIESWESEVGENGIRGIYSKKEIIELEGDSSEPLSSVGWLETKEEILSDFKTYPFRPKVYG